MIRSCLQTSSYVKLIEKPDGTWGLEGFGAEQYASSVQLAEQAQRPFNTSFYLTLHAEECITRLEKNLSDISSVLMPISSQLPGVQVSEIVYANEVKFLAGYSTFDGQNREKETATALTNVYLLDYEVYEFFFLLLLCFVSFIAFRILLLRSFRKRSPHRVWRLVRRKITKVFLSSSRSFRWIQFLYSLLIFYMVTSLLCLYKTSRVVVDTAFYPKSYEQSLNYNSSLAFYFDQFAAVSDRFKDAPVSTVKGKLWRKLLASGKSDYLVFDEASSSQATLPLMMLKVMREVMQSKSIVIAASTMIPLIKFMACGLSPENELWVTKILSQPSEPEIIYGAAMRSANSFEKHINARYRRLNEAHIFYRHLELAASSVTQLFSQVAGTSREHQVKQLIALDNEHAFKETVHIKSIPLTYFKVFFTACPVIWMLAFVINFLRVGPEMPR